MALVASNEASDLKRRAADIAIRNFRPTQPDLIARKIGHFSATLYGTPDLLLILGEKSQRESKSLDGIPFIGFVSNNETYRQALVAQGIPVAESNFPVRTDSHPAHWEMTKLGMGIGMMPVELGDAEPVVRRAFEETTFGGEVWLVSHRELRMNLRVRTVFDFLAGELAEYYGQG